MVKCVVVPFEAEFTAVPIDPIGRDIALNDDIGGVEEQQRFAV